MPGRATHTLIAVALTLALTLNLERVQGGAASVLIALLLTYTVFSLIGVRWKGLWAGVLGGCLTWLWSTRDFPWLIKALRGLWSSLDDYAQLGLILLACLIGARIPDFDLYSGHRVRLHNLAAMLGSALCFWIALSILSEGVNLAINVGLSATISRAMILSYGLHLAVDLLTPRGMALLYPLSGRMFHAPVRGLNKAVAPVALIALLALVLTHWATLPTLKGLISILEGLFRFV
ncbi:MAG: hypothetical protein QXK12_05125 [Candidatus Nezhaarchaeales archaeon]